MGDDAQTAYRMSVILVRLGHLLGDSGVLPPEHAAEMINNNGGIQYVATMLELSPPGAVTQPWPGLEV